METNFSEDLGERIIYRLKEIKRIMDKINIKNEEDITSTYSYGTRP